LQITTHPDPDTTTLTIHTRPDTDTEDPDTPAWTLHATATLTHNPTPPEQNPPVDHTAWPPPHTTPVDLTHLYDRLTDHHYTYGPAFHNLTHLTHNPATGQLHATLTLPDTLNPTGHTLHPALLDAALHALLATTPDLTTTLIPHTLHHTTHHPTPQPPTTLHATLTPTGHTPHHTPHHTTPTTYHLTATTPHHPTTPTLTINQLTLHPITTDQFGGGRGDRAPVYDVVWADAELAVSGVDLEREAVVWGEDTLGLGARLGIAVTGVPDRAVRYLLVTAGRGGEDGAAAEAGRFLDLVRGWLADPARDGSTLVVVDGGPGAESGAEEGLRTAAVWGLLRTVAAENPGRVRLVEMDADDAGSLAALPRALACDEPELRLADGRMTVPRLAATEPDVVGAGLDPEGTVLVTGATGALGSAVTRHLAVAHGVRRFLLLSRRGPAAEGAAELLEELRAAGAQAVLAACDVGDRDALAEVLGTVDPGHPLTGVFHTAGVLDDGVVQSLDAGRLARVWRPKADGARYLHELTRDGELAAFVLFSSVAGQAGNAGQATYAAANTFLDALAHHRRALGLAATSVAWGLWQGTGEQDGMGAARTGLGGLRALTVPEGLALLDAVLGDPRPLLVAARFDLAGLRERAEAGTLAARLRGLVRRSAARGARGGGVPLSERFSALGRAEQLELCLRLVRTTVAAVLGHLDDSRIEDEQPFKSVGFDSLTAVELRNRLSAAAGVPLPATLVFDYPTPVDLARYLWQTCRPPQAPAPVLAELDRLEAALAADTDTDDGLRRAVAGRLERLLAELLPASGRAAGEEADAVARIQDASAAEIFDLIDEEFGRTD
ncbi:type I polyketide synthase, partial [Streptomyces fuscichromogenes]|uniref:type I polyketide synthase n=1 Tax=Streptomyces fuscichromogenes TaxID=1324013 RepID=UPI0016717F42